MKKIIQFLIILILLAVLALVVIVAFNPADLRTKLIGGIINSYLESNLSDYQPSSTSEESGSYDHPLLDDSQEAMLEDLGVDVSQLPSSITPEMEACFINKFGEERVAEIVNGATPSAFELFKAKDCL